MDTRVYPFFRVRTRDGVTWIQPMGKGMTLALAKEYFFPSTKFQLSDDQDRVVSVEML